MKQFATTQHVIENGDISHLLNFFTAGPNRILLYGTIYCIVLSLQGNPHTVLLKSYLTLYVFFFSQKQSN